MSALSPNPFAFSTSRTSCAKNPILMASAMKHAIEAGSKAYEAGRIEKKQMGVASSPTDGMITDD